MAPPSWRSLANEGNFYPVNRFHPRFKESQMRKLMLDLETLTVESFSTSAAPGERGTVAAHESNNTYCITEAHRLSCGQTQCGGCTSNDSDDGFCPGSVYSCPGACAGTYEHTCYGHTNCGTCAPAATCDLQYGCSGNSMDMQPC